MFTNSAFLFIAFILFVNSAVGYRCSDCTKLRFGANDENAVVATIKYVKCNGDCDHAIVSCPTDKMYVLVVRVNGNNENLAIGTGFEKVLTCNGEKFEAAPIGSHENIGVEEIACVPLQNSVV